MEWEREQEKEWEKVLPAVAAPAGTVVVLMVPRGCVSARNAVYTSIISRANRVQN